MGDGVSDLVRRCPAKASTRDALYDFIDALRLGAVIRLDHTGHPETICVGDRECIDQIAYAVEKHLRSANL